jgi:hypothetical protein
VTGRDGLAPPQFWLGAAGLSPFHGRIVGHRAEYV